WIVWPRVCVECPENESAFSKFAYYLYLVDRTEKTYHDLEITLFHDFSRLTPADGDEDVPQVLVCNEILRLALGRDLTGDEQLPEVGYRVLSILRDVVPRSPAQIVAVLQSAVSGGLAPDLESRLAAAFATPPPATDADMLAPQPGFTSDEVQLLAAAGEAI